MQFIKFDHIKRDYQIVTSCLVMTSHHCIFWEIHTIKCIHLHVSTYIMFHWRFNVNWIIWFTTNHYNTLYFLLETRFQYNVNNKLWINMVKFVCLNSTQGTLYCLKLIKHSFVPWNLQSRNLSFQIPKSKVCRPSGAMETSSCEWNIYEYNKLNSQNHLILIAKDS